MYWSASSVRGLLFLAPPPNFQIDFANVYITFHYNTLQCITFIKRKRKRKYHDFSNLKICAFHKNVYAFDNNMFLAYNNYCNEASIYVAR